EVTLGGYFRMVLAQWKWVSAIVLVAIAAAVTVALVTIPVYRATVLLIPTTSGQQSSGLSNLISQYSNLASLAGVSAPDTGTKAVAIATLSSRAFSEQFVAEQNLLPLLFPKKWDAASKRWIVPQKEIPTLSDGARKFMEDVRRIAVDKETGLITISIDWRN